MLDRRAIVCKMLGWPPVRLQRSSKGSAKCRAEGPERARRHGWGEGGEDAAKPIDHVNRQRSSASTRWLPKGGLFLSRVGGKTNLRKRWKFGGLVAQVPRDSWVFPGNPAPNPTTPNVGPPAAANRLRKGEGPAVHILRTCSGPRAHGDGSTGEAFAGSGKKRTGFPDRPCRKPPHGSADTVFVIDVTATIFVPYPIRFTAYSIDCRFYVSDAKWINH